MPYTQITRLQLREMLKSKWENVPFWTDAEANAGINEAIQWFNLYTGVWRWRVAMTTVAGQVYYTVPSTLIYNARCEYNGKTMAISSLTDMDNGRPGWEGETTADGGDVPTRPRMWIPVGMNLFAIWPADAAGQNSLLIDGVRETPTLDNDAAYLDLDDSDADIIVGEALFLLCFKDAGRFAHVSGWHQEFLRAVLGRVARLKASNMFLQAAGMDQARVTRPLSIEDDK